MDLHFLSVLLGTMENDQMALFYIRLNARFHLVQVKSATTNIAWGLDKIEVHIPGSLSAIRVISRKPPAAKRRVISCSSIWPARPVSRLKHEGNGWSGSHPIVFLGVDFNKSRSNIHSRSPFNSFLWHPCRWVEGVKYNRHFQIRYDSAAAVPCLMTTQPWGALP